MLHPAAAVEIDTSGEEADKLYNANNYIWETEAITE